MGNPQLRFSLTLDQLTVSIRLSKLIQRDSESGAYVMAPFLSAIPADEFRYVQEYLEQGDYHPHLLDSDKDYARLEYNVSTDGLKEQIELCTKLDNIAGRLEITTLQQLVTRKLNFLLTTAEPSAVDSILTVLPPMVANARPSLREVFIDFIADRLLTMMRQNNEHLVTLLEQEPVLKREIFARAAVLDTERPMRCEAYEAAQDLPNPVLSGAIKTEGGNYGTAKAAGKKRLQHQHEHEVTATKESLFLEALKRSQIET